MRHLSIPSLLLPGAALALGAAAGAQDAPFNATFLDRFDQGGSSYADVWGDGNYAYVARFGQSEIDIVDVSNPNNISLAANYDIVGANNGSSTQDIKVGDGLMFIAIESGGSDGVEIVDVRNPNSPQFLTTVDPEPGDFEFIHNVFYHDGWLYMCNSSDNTIAIVDLRNYDPDNPPGHIGGWDYRLTSVGGIFVHDITVQHGRLYASSWDSLRVYDVSNLGTQAPQFLGSVQGINSHAAWATDDGQFVAISEEREAGPIRLYEIVDNGGSVDFIPRDSHLAPPNKAFSTHNCLWLGDRLYASYYQWGTLVFQLDRNTKTLELVASYDTTNSSTGNGFTGNWGAYPFLGEDVVLMSDIGNGLYTVDMSAIQFTFPTALPTVVDNLTPTTITVQTTELGNSTLDTMTLFTSVEGAGYTQTPMISVGGGQYEADLPLAPCGQKIDFYISADDNQGRTFTSPASAPSETHTAYSAPGTVNVLTDLFNSNNGWSVQNTGVSTGAWTRVNPIGTGAQPENDDPDSTGTFCYVTGNGNGSDGSFDLDGGPTRLVSPTLDFSAGDGLISYTRWFFNSNSDSDNLQVQVSNNDGSTWTTVENVTQEAGGWVRRTFRVSDYVEPTNEVKVRFNASDQPNNSVTEAGIDTFVAETFDCVSNASATIRNGTGVNPVVYSNLTLPKLGTNWESEIDTTIHPGSFFTYVVGYEAPTTGPIFGFGELLVDVTSPPVHSTLSSTIGNISSYSIAIPADGGLVGYQAYNQGIIFGGGYAEVTNAIDLVLDF